MIQKFQTISLRRKIVALTMALTLAIGGIASWAAVSDTLVTTNNYAVTSVDLNGSADGTTYTNTASINWGLENTTQINRVLYLKNVGNTDLSFQAGFRLATTDQPGDVTWTASGATAITNAMFNIGSITNVSECPASGVPTATFWFDTTSKVSALVHKGVAGGSPNPNPKITIAPGGTAMLCMTAKPATGPGTTDVATQTLSIVTRGGLGT